MKVSQNSSAYETCLGVFGKYWQAGQVKTRLAKGIGDQQTSLVYLALLRTILQRLSEIADRRMLAYWPSHRLQEFADLAGPCWELTPQVAEECHSGQDLGQRMKDFFALQFQQGAGRVVLVGSDSPTLPVAFIEQAFAALLEQQVVLGPAADGGYYLVGMSQFEPRIFDDIPWSTAQVFERTVAKLEQYHLPSCVLPQWSDVDDLEDLLRLRKQLQDSRSRDEHCDKLLAELDVVLGELS